MGMIDLAALALIVLLGVPHGALDPMLAIRAGVPKRIGAIAFFHVIYISIAASFWLFWIGFGPFALIAFLALSIWHFGGDALPGDAPALHRLAYGSWVLVLPMAFSPDQVSHLFGLLINRCASQNCLVGGAGVAQPIRGLFYRRHPPHGVVRFGRSCRVVVAPVVLRDFLLSVTQSSASDSRVPQTVVNRTLDRRRRHGRDDDGYPRTGTGSNRIIRRI